MIYINGNIISPEQVKIEYNDRGLLLSDGLFETMRVYQGSVFCLKEHFERLKKGADFLKIPVLFTLVELEKIIIDVLVANNLLGRDASLRLTIACGVGPRGLLPPS